MRRRRQWMVWVTAILVIFLETNLSTVFAQTRDQSPPSGDHEQAAPQETDRQTGPIYDTIMNADLSAMLDCLEIRFLFASGSIGDDDPETREKARSQARTILRRHRLRLINRAIEAAGREYKPKDGEPPTPPTEAVNRHLGTLVSEDCVSAALRNYETHADAEVRGLAQDLRNMLGGRWPAGR